MALATTGREQRQTLPHPGKGLRMFRRFCIVDVCATAQKAHTPARAGGVGVEWSTSRGMSSHPVTRLLTSDRLDHFGCFDGVQYAVASSTNPLSPRFSVSSLPRVPEKEQHRDTGGDAFVSLFPLTPSIQAPLAPTPIRAEPRRANTVAGPFTRTFNPFIYRPSLVLTMSC